MDSLPVHQCGVQLITYRTASGPEKIRPKMSDNLLSSQDKSILF